MYSFDQATERFVSKHLGKWDNGIKRIGHSDSSDDGGDHRVPASMWSRWVENARNPSYCIELESPALQSDTESGDREAAEQKLEEQERRIHHCRSLRMRMILFADGVWKLAKQKKA